MFSRTLSERNLADVLVAFVLDDDFRVNGDTLMGTVSGFRLKNGVVIKHL